VYLTTQALRTIALTLDTSDHRDACKRACPVQGSVSVSMLDMGGQVRRQRAGAPADGAMA
jgi:hypothetical protein